MCACVYMCVHVYMCTCTGQLCPSCLIDRLNSSGAYFFEFLEKAFDGAVVSEVKVGQLDIQTTLCFIGLPAVEDTRHSKLHFHTS